MKTGQKVLVAMSGGVDSSVTALLLKEQGYSVVGAHMKLWDYVDVGGDIYRDGRCCSLDSITDCRFVCEQIDAPFYVLNLSDRFKKTVIEDFVNEYKAGRTPNPCVRCNIDLKWDAFLAKAEEIGCNLIATGHYSFIEKNDNGRWQIKMGVDSSRDQSYVLWGLPQAALAKTLMPLGGLLKTEVREIARKYGLKSAEKAESREICFVADDNYRRFLQEYEEKEGRQFEGGEIVHRDGKVLGEHEGTAYFTIGQRKGLKITWPTPLYVQEIDAAKRRVVVGGDEGLYAKTLVAESVNWMAGQADSGEVKAGVKIRYLHPPAEALIKPVSEKKVMVTFSKAQRAITPGQSVVFYQGDILLGGGIIS